MPPLSKNCLLFCAIPASAAWASAVSVLVTDILGNAHGTELRPAHGAEMRGLGWFGRQRLVMEFLGCDRVQGQRELVMPAELEARLAQRIIASRGPRVALGQICGVRGDLVGDDAGFHIIPVRQSQMLFGSDVAEHRGAVAGDLGGADGAGDVVVARSDIGDQRAQRVERSPIAQFLLALHILAHQVERDMPRSFHHHLNVVLPGALGQLCQGVQLGELGGVIGIRNGTRAQPVAQRERHIVLREDLAQLIEVGVEEILLMVRQAPACHDGPAARDHAGDAVGGQRDVAQQHSGVDGHVVHALLALLNDGVPEDLPRQFISFAIDLLQSLVDRHGADGHRRIADDPLAGGVDVISGGQVHDRVRTPLGGPLQLGDFLGDGAGHRRIADIRIDFHQEGLADDHRLGFRVVYVRRDDGPAGRKLAAHQFDIAFFAYGNIAHFRGDDPGPGIVHLGHTGCADGPSRRRRASGPLCAGGASANRRASVIVQIAFSTLIGFHIPAFQDPRFAERLQSLGGFASRSAGAIHLQRFI